jgi:hypothetical protein
MREFDKIIVGLFLGIVGPFIGFWIYYLFQFNHKSPDDFIRMFIAVKEIQAPILSLSLIFNLALFFILIKINFEKSAKGVLFATFMYIPVMIILKYF